MRSGSALSTVAEDDLSADADFAAKSSPDLSVPGSRPVRSCRLRLKSWLSSRVSFMLLPVLLAAGPSRRRNGLGVDVIQGPGFHVVLGQPFKIHIHIPEIETGIGRDRGGIGDLFVRHRPRPKYRPQLGDLGAKLLDLGVEQRI